MKVRVHLVIEDGPVDGEPGRRLELRTSFEAARAFGPDPVIGSVRAVSDLAGAAVKEVGR
jgi:hypothetical protein